MTQSENSTTIAFTSLTFNLSGHDDGNCSRDEFVGTQMALYGILPVAVLGIVGNGVAFWVWHAENAFSATPFLFKWLAMCDILYLMFNVAFVVLFLPCCYAYTPLVIVTHTRNLTQIMSVHTTLLVAITRWLAVWLPLRVNRFLTKKSVTLCCVALACWCSAIELVEIARKSIPDEKKSGETDRAMLSMHEVLGYVLPWFLLLVISLHLIFTTRRSLRQAHVLRMREIGAGFEDERFRRLTLTVLCVALSSFVAYPIGVIVEMVSSFQFYNSCEGHHYYDILATLGGLLQVINSSINVLFYWAFVSRFRELLKQRLARLLRRDSNQDDHTFCSMHTMTQRLSVSSSANPYALNGSGRPSHRSSDVSTTGYGTTNGH